MQRKVEFGRGVVEEAFEMFGAEVGDSGGEADRGVENKVVCRGGTKSRR